MASGSYYIYIKNVKADKSNTSPTSPTDYNGNDSPNNGGNGDGDGGTKPWRPDDGNGRGNIPDYVPYAPQVNAVKRLFSGGTGGFAKASIALAIIVKTLKIAEQATTSINNYVATQTGDYSSKLQWDNLDTEIKNATHPISSAVSAFLTQEAWQRSNLARDEQRTLLGDTQINTLTKGV